MSETIKINGNEYKLSKEKLNVFWSFIQKRQQIWYRRTILQNNPPWTKDKILQNHRFTNVYRELD
ncbi:MAG: nucleotide kinase domain-containing protein, partial [Candidatus Nanohaloarchaea archaeon]